MDRRMSFVDLSFRKIFTFSLSPYSCIFFSFGGLKTFTLKLPISVEMSSFFFHFLTKGRF